MDVRQARVAAECNCVRHPWELARFRVLARLFAAYPTPSGAGVLDVGCGDGYVAESLAAMRPGLRLFGVDPELPESMIGPAAGGRVAYARGIAGLACEAAAIRTILILDVLEHIEDDAGALREILEDAKVAEDATVIVFVPAFQSLFYSHDRVLSHYRRYNRGSLVRRLEQCGLRTVESGYFFAAFLPVRMMEVALERCGAAAPKTMEYSATWKSGPAPARFIAAALYLEFVALRALARLGLRLPGLSVYAVARRDGTVASQPPVL